MRKNLLFNENIPEHIKAAQILNSKGRNATNFVVEAILAYEEYCNDKSFEQKVLTVINKNFSDISVADKKDEISLTSKKPSENKAEEVTVENATLEDEAALSQMIDDLESAFG